MKRERLNWKSVVVGIILAGAFMATQASARQTQSNGQTSTSAQSTDKDKIADRKENQQDRIAQGVKSGQLTAGETARLETKESRLNKEIRTDRAASGGKQADQRRESPGEPPAESALEPDLQGQAQQPHAAPQGMIEPLFLQEVCRCSSVWGSICTCDEQNCRSIVRRLRVCENGVRGSVPKALTELMLG